MSTPPPAYYPPGPSRSGPNCWLVGGIGCLVLLAVVIVLAFASVNALVNSPQGKKLVKSFTSMASKAGDVEVCTEKMKLVQEAIVRYHLHTGKYPATLKTMVPDYITDPGTLHCGLDDNPDPSHVSFAYTKPKEGAPASTVILTVDWKYSMDIGSQTATTDMTLGVTLDGQTRQTQSRTTSTSSG